MKIRLKAPHFFAFISTFLPMVSFAQANFVLAGQNFKGVIYYALGIVDSLIPVAFAAAFLVFAWGMSKFILKSSSPADIQNGKNYMMWAILALFLMLTYRTIIVLVASDLEIFGGIRNINNVLPSK